MGSRKALFHLALAAGVVPVLGLPIVLLIALMARGEREPRWTRRIRALVAIDVLTSLVVITTATGLLPSIDAEAIANPPRIGIMIDERDRDAGVRVASVLEGGPAEDAGIKSGDVIVSIGDTPVRDAAEFRRKIEMAPGAVSLELRRGELSQRVEVEPTRTALAVAGGCGEMQTPAEFSLGTAVSYGSFVIGS